MSEFTHTRERRLGKLLELSHQLLAVGHAREFLAGNPDFTDQVIPSDFILLFDALIREGVDIQSLIPVSNKIFNIFYQTLVSHERIVPPPGSLLWAIEQNNRTMNEVLEEIRPVFRLFLGAPSDASLKTNLKSELEKLQLYTRIYTIKENILFPAIEKYWPDFRCVQLMWAFHDEIRARLQEAIAMTEIETIDLSRFNRLIGDIFFFMKTIQLRDERILFPEILTTIEPEAMANWLAEAVTLGFPYYTPEISSQNIKSDVMPESGQGYVDLGSGKLTIEQIRLIFNHLPVDITYVDENDEVKFFSTPPNRIFPRTVAIIGRNVKNCHPPNSMQIVERIVESFRRGEKERASFWIRMRGDFILIQYFAVRDETRQYRGVIEVTQEISEIRSLEGEKRLLDW